MPMPHFVILAGAALALAGAAHAADLGDTPIRAAVVVNPALVKGTDIPQQPAGSLAFPDTLASVVRAPGIARTSVEHKFQSRLSGSAGLLCGLQPSLDDKGAATATGWDPHGRFVGAKLSLAF